MDLLKKMAISEKSAAGHDFVKSIPTVMRQYNIHGTTLPVACRNSSETVVSCPELDTDHSIANEH